MESGNAGRPLPLVSIILPTYNRLGYLQEAVASVQLQSFGDWELIVIDDGSSDGSAEWLSRLPDPRIRLITQQHTAALSALRNVGIAASSPEWIAFLDDDDRWHPAKLERQLALHRGHRRLRWSYTGRALIDASGNSLPDDRFRDWQPVSGWIVPALLVHDAKIALPSVIAQRSLLDEVGGFDEGLPFGEAYDLWLRLARIAECGVVPEPLTTVRLHPGNSTRDQPEVNRSLIRVYARFAQSTNSALERRICRRQQATYAVFLARQQLTRGERRATFGTLTGALKLRPFYPWAWRTVGKALLASLISAVSRGRASGPATQ